MLLKLGMSGPDVANLERAVEALGFQGVPMDGVYDDKLANVITYIQKTYKDLKGNPLVVDGKAGDLTLAVIDALYEPDKPNFSSSNHVPEDVWPDIIGDVTGPLATVHPTLIKKVQKIIELAAAEGFHLVCTQGTRTFAQQHKLFLQRPKVTNADQGQSYHNYGVAADLAFVIKAKNKKGEMVDTITWDEKYYKNIGRWANQVGLTWGGNWRFVDFPHVQLPDMPATAKLLAVYRMASGDVEDKVRAVWNKYVGG